MTLLILEWDVGHRDDQLGLDALAGVVVERPVERGQEQDVHVRVEDLLGRDDPHRRVGLDRGPTHGVDLGSDDPSAEVFVRPLADDLGPDVATDPLDRNRQIRRTRPVVDALHRAHRALDRDLRREVRRVTVRSDDVLGLLGDPTDVLGPDVHVLGTDVRAAQFLDHAADVVEQISAFGRSRGKSRGIPEDERLAAARHSAMEDGLVRHVSREKHHDRERLVERAEPEANAAERRSERPIVDGHDEDDSMERQGPNIDPLVRLAGHPLIEGRSVVMHDSSPAEDLCVRSE